MKKTIFKEGYNLGLEQGAKDMIEILLKNKWINTRISSELIYDAIKQQEEEYKKLK
jgi:hypothetical protein